MTRPATPEEKAAARDAGLPVPSVVEVVMTSAAEQHAARLGAPRKSPKPPGMSTSDYYSLRAGGSYGQPDAEEETEVEETEETEEEPKAGTVASSGPRFRTSGGAIII